MYVCITLTISFQKKKKMLKPFFFKIKKKEEEKMGSSDEEKMGSLDFIESKSTTTLVVQSPIQLCPNSTFLSLQEIIGRVMDCESEIYDKILRYLKDIDVEIEKGKGSSSSSSNSNLNVKKSMILLKLKMDKYEACLCKSSWVSVFGPPFTRFYTFAPPSREYEYIDVMVKDGKNGGEETRLIIDMDFRSQFEVWGPTESYSQLTNALPLLFVGTEAKLISIINLVCSASKQSFKESGVRVPPWRKVGYMKSKWLSQNYKKFSLSAVV